MPAKTLGRCPSHPWQSPISRLLSYTGLMDKTWAYFNGDWIPGAELRIAVDDVGFIFGATVTERLRTFRHQVYRLDEHLRRLRHSLEIIGLDADAIARQVAAAVPKFLADRGLVADDDD